MTTVIFLGILLVLIPLLLFPVVGLAMLPVAAVALVVVVAAAGIVATRGPRALPERTTSPDEPSELGTDRER